MFAFDMSIKEGMYGVDLKYDTKHTERKLLRPMVAFLLFLGVESWAWYLFLPHDALVHPPIFTSIFKPLAFFYFSAKARDSLEALLRISKIVMRVLLVEFGLILTFASVACRMFGDFDSFHTLSRSWVSAGGAFSYELSGCQHNVSHFSPLCTNRLLQLSLFERKCMNVYLGSIKSRQSLMRCSSCAVSTTVVNPSLWMPIYHEGAANSLFFVVFIVTCTFYYHSLVLSVVFQTYIQAITEVCESDAVQDSHTRVTPSYIFVPTGHLPLLSTHRFTNDLHRIEKRQCDCRSWH